ncbi:unnamed protein product [Meganyctiphanes norvegica]|uniref:Acyltransferase 3 domain-containing protein n=1 Tax=Meganyctiphanes norvegica TaxID=48144 RepID=A0AAV2RWL1_MEGNR
MSYIWTVLGTLVVCGTVAADVTIPGHQRQVTQTLREILGRWYYPIQLGGIRSDTQAAVCAAHSALALTTEDTWGYTMWDAHGKLPDGYGAGATEARGHAGLCRTVEAEFSGPLSAHLHRYRDNLLSFNTSYQHLVRGLQGQHNTSFKGKYCLVNIRSETMSEEKPAAGGSSMLLSLLAEQFEHSYASCVPDSCTGLLLQESLGNQRDINGTVSVICEEDAELDTFSNGDYAFCLLTVGLMTLVISAWALESWSPDDTTEHTICPSCTPGRRLLRCFSPVENGKRLMSMGCSASGQNFKSLDGLRSISMIWVILAHRYMFFLLSVSNPQDILQHRNSWQYWWVFNAYPSVDTFLFISAFLVSVFLKDRIKKFSLTGFYLTRYFRLLPAMVYVMLGCMTILKHMGSGLVWHRVYEGLFGSPCQKYAWANLFFINNLLDSNEMCMGHLWSLAAEWQLYLITPLILVPLYKWKHPVLRILPLSFATILSIVIPAVVTILWKLPTTASFPDLMSSTVYYNSYYMVPWCRAGPYCVGIFAGWGYHWLNDTKPTIKKEYLVIGSIFTSIASLMVLLGPCLLTGRSVYWAALYTSLARPLWAVSIAFVVLCTGYGKKGIISWVCEWPIWGPLCRVSYCMFLVSLPLQSWAAARPQKMHYDSITAGYLVAGDLVLSFTVGCALVLLVEAPAARILNLLLLGKLRGKSSKNKTTEKVKDTEVIGKNQTTR